LEGVASVSMKKT